MTKNYEKDLLQSIFELIDELIQIFDDLDKGVADDYFAIRIFFEAFSAKSLVAHCETFILPYKEEIYKHNLDFFASNKGIFSGLNAETVDRHRKYILKFPQEDIDTMFSYFENFIELLEQIKKTA